MNHKYNDSLTFKIESEMDLHVKVVSFLKKRYQHSIFTATFGQNQDTINNRIESHKKATSADRFDNQQSSQTLHWICN